MDNNEKYSEIKDFIISKYVELKKPILLSQLGYELKKNKYTLNLGIKKFIETEMKDYTVVTSNKSIEKSAISLLKEEEETRKLVNMEFSPHATSDSEIFYSLYHSFVYAFIKNPDLDSFISNKIPFKFTLENCKHSSDIRIAKEYKVKTSGEEVKAVSQDEIKNILTSMRDWCAENNFTLENFKVLQRRNSHKTESHHYYSLHPKIQEFIDAQPNNVKSSLVIPYSFLTK